jgi:O-succinylbenzoic acid--CoA ligase
MPTRRLQAIPCPLEAASVAAFLPLLRAALDGGPALLPMPLGPAQQVDQLRHELRPDVGVDEATTVVIATSGSTGTPKGVQLSSAALRASAQATHQRLGGPGHWLLALPVHHIAGLQVLVRTIDGGGVLSTVDRTTGFTTALFVAAAAELPHDAPRYTALVPTQLARLLDDVAAVSALASFDGVLLGGSASPAPLLDRARTAGIPVRTTYGMSETAGGCVYDGEPLDGTRVDAGDDGVGAIRLGGATLSHGYLHRPDLTDAAFADGWFTTGDLGRWTPQRRLEVLGRVDDLIISGGENVVPLLVERALTDVAGVRDACVVGIPDEEWGQAVVAVVVPSDPAAPPATGALRDAVAGRVGRHAVPKRLSLVDAVPQLESGKADRAAVAALLAATSRAT